MLSSLLLFLMRFLSKTAIVVGAVENGITSLPDMAKQDFSEMWPSGPVLSWSGGGEAKCGVDAAQSGGTMIRQLPRIAGTLLEPVHIEGKFDRARIVRGDSRCAAVHDSNRCLLR